MTKEAILTVSDLSLYYSKKKALNQINMEFYPNEITALIGPSGCGKSTLLRSINRMNDLIPTVTITGAIMYKGHNIYSPKVDTVDLRKEIGMVFQQPNPFPFSIYENVVYGLRDEVKIFFILQHLVYLVDNNNVCVSHVCLLSILKLSCLMSQRQP